MDVILQCGNHFVDFVHFSDKRLPQKTDPHEKKRQHQLEMEREKKWLKMLKNWNHFSMSEKLRRRIYKGIPEKLRGQVWSRLLNIDTVREEQQGKYEVRTKQNKTTYHKDAVAQDLELCLFTLTLSVSMFFKVSICHEVSSPISCIHFVSSPAYQNLLQQWCSLKPWHV
jgi:hypothetical protein